MPSIRRFIDYPSYIDFNASDLNASRISFSFRMFIIARDSVWIFSTLSNLRTYFYFWKEKEAVRRKRSEKWRTKNWILPNDSASAHMSLVTQFLASNNMAVVLHLPYSPDLASCDFFLFPKLKIKMKSRRFVSVEDIQTESRAVMNTLTKKDFQDAFKSRQKYWDRCIRSQEYYFECDDGE